MLLQLMLAWIMTGIRLITGLIPVAGNEIKITAAVGIKNIKKNNEILNLKDPAV